MRHMNASLNFRGIFTARNSEAKTPDNMIKELIDFYEKSPAMRVYKLRIFI